MADAAGQSVAGAPPGRVHAGIDIVADRWSLWLLATLEGRDGARFSDLARAPGLSRRVLSERLRALATAGLVEPVAYSTRPPRHRYRLSARGVRCQRHAVAMLHVAAGGALDEPTHPQPAASSPPAESVATPVAPADLPADPVERMFAHEPALARDTYVDTVAAVARYDDQYRTSLLQTLEVYLECDASVGVAAGRLYAHRHTVRYRLGRIRELSGLDVDSLADRERLAMGLKALRALRAMGDAAPVTLP